MTAPTLQCVSGFDDERAAAYVAGRLHDAALEQYELHLLGCAACRENVRHAAELRAGLRRLRRRRLAGWAAATGGLAAAAVAWMVLRPSALERLGRVDSAPALGTMEVRANVDSSAVFATRGAQAYRESRYDDAAAALERATRDRPESGTAFFLGAALLMSGHPDSAIAVFRRVDELGGVVYSPEAHFYSAKSWLQLGRRDSALVHLRLADRAASPALARWALALIDSIEASR